MKIWVPFFVFLILATDASALVKHKKPAVSTKHSTTKASSVSSARKKPAARRTYTARHSSSRGRTAAVAHTAPAPARQSSPSSDRYREIQESLAQKGYLTTPPNGVWDQNAQEAMRKFQADQQLSVTGKLSSRSLIALGLGNSVSAASPAPPTPKP